MITPTVGRMLWVRRRPGSFDNRQPEAAVVTYVHERAKAARNDESVIDLINVVGWDAHGATFTVSALYLHQGDEKSAPTSTHACWMPYQQGQAAKAEELERKLEARK